MQKLVFVFFVILIACVFAQKEFIFVEHAISGGYFVGGLLIRQKILPFTHPGLETTRLEMVWFLRTLFLMLSMCN